MTMFNSKLCELDSRLYFLAIWILINQTRTKSLLIECKRSKLDQLACLQGWNAQYHRHLSPKNIPNICLQLSTEDSYSICIAISKQFYVVVFVLKIPKVPSVLSFFLELSKTYPQLNSMWIRFPILPFFRLQDLWVIHKPICH